jgi:hypothetical protein
MSRTSRILASLMMIALVGLTAQSASASPLTVEGISSWGQVFLSGDQDGVSFQFGSSGGSCQEASFFFATKTVNAEAIDNELTMTPVIPTQNAKEEFNCRIGGVGGLPVHIFTNGCTYTFTTPTQIKSGEVTWNSPTQLHLVCPAGKRIEITPTYFGVSNCTQYYEAQTPTEGHIVGRNVAGSSPMNVTLEIKMAGLHYADCRSETNSDGSFTLNSRVRCFKNEAHTIQTGCTFS